jgi:hypothetical protein
MYPRSSKVGTPRVDHQETIQELIDVSIMNDRTKRGDFAAGLSVADVHEIVDAALVANPGMSEVEIQALIDSSILSSPSRISQVFSKSGVLTTGAGTNRLVNTTGRTLSINAVTASVGTAPTGASILVDVTKNGTSIFTTQGNRPTIAIGAFSGVSGVPELTWAAGEYLTVDVDQIGSTVAGSDLTVQVSAK